MTEPTENLQEWQSFKRVLAGQITEVVEAGCYVQNTDRTTTLRLFEPGMTTRYQPTVGDFWVVYPPDNYQSISPHAQFVTGYIQIDAIPLEPATLESAICHAINRFSAETESNTPDHVLTEYLMDCLRAFNRVTTARGRWPYGGGKLDTTIGAPTIAELEAILQADPGTPVRIRPDGTVDVGGEL